MSESRNVDPFSALVLVVSLVGIILVAVSYFAGFYYTGYGNRYSCLDCEYSTGGDLTAQIFMIILLIIQIVFVVNELLPNRFIPYDLTKIGMGLAALTMVFAFIGLGSFGAEYSEYDWWPETGFYGGVFSGLINVILFFLSLRRR